MNVLLLGTGMQGKAALHFLASHPDVSAVTAADADLDRLEAHVAANDYQAVTARPLDARDPASIDGLMGSGAAVAIDLLPITFIDSIARAAVSHGVHLVNAFYVSPGLRALAGEADRAGVAILPEFGLDPGIDLVLLGEAIRRFDVIEEVVTYGAGVPEPEAADNPLKYKISWTLKGVLDSYYRPGTVVENGRVVPIPSDRMFAPENLHEIELAGVGRLEAFPNGDIIEQLDRLGLAPDRLRRAGRYSMRWPGHSAFWRSIVELGLLDDEPVVAGGTSVDRRGFLAAALEPRLQYRPGESDIAIVRVEVAGTTGGRAHREVLEVVSRRDPHSGILAMGRTTGFTAAIGAVLVGTGRITKRGLLSPLTDVPFDLFVAELAKAGIELRSDP